MTRRTYSSRNAFPSIAFRKRLLPAIVAAGHMMTVPAALAGPEGGNVVAGSGAITKSDKQTTITQRSDRLIAEWDSFDLASDEVVTYLQPGRDAVALNRILSQSASNIRGRINANGHVVLINPRGVVFGESAQVNVDGIIASGLDIANEDFLSGDLVFSEVANTEGKVINQGMITAATGGNVVLQGKSVKNEGLISAHMGSVSLASGLETVVTFDEAGLMGVRVARSQLQGEGNEDALVNAGSITAEGGRVLLTASTSRDIFSQAVNTGELADAKSVLMHEDGSFTLGAGGNVSNTGTISVSSGDVGAGQVALIGENVNHTGEIAANATNHGAAGTIELHSRNTTLLEGSSVTESRHESGIGGEVYALGDRVGVADSSRVDVSGTTGGGTILVGGDYKGDNQLVRNSQRTFVGRDAVLNADATAKGDGGEVIVWSDEATRFYGSLTAKGAGQTGRGGFAEVSGKDQLLFRGDANLSGTAASGTLLLDPQDITISIGGSEVDLDSQQITFDLLPSDNITINNFDIQDHLNQSGNLVLNAYRDIVIDANIETNQDSTSSLTLRAGDDIVVGNDRQMRIGKGNLSFYSGSIAAHDYCKESTYSCAEGSQSDTDQIGGRSILIKGSIDTEGEILFKSGGQIKVDGSIGQTLSPSSVEFLSTYQTTVNGAVTLSALDESIVGDNERGLVISAGDDSLAGGDDAVGIITGDNVDDLSPEAVVNSTILTQGRFADIDTPGAVLVRGSISTAGGDFLIGDSDDRVGSFTSYFENETDPAASTWGTVSTGGGAESESRNAGKIRIYASGDVDLGELSIEQDYVALNNNGGSESIGSVEVFSSGSITLYREFNFNNSGPFTWDGQGGEVEVVEDGETVTKRLPQPHLTFDADSDINLRGRIYDQYADARESLNVTFNSSSGAVNLYANVFTGGGNISIDADTVDFRPADATSTARLDTQHANLEATNDSDEPIEQLGDEWSNYLNNLSDGEARHLRPSDGGDVTITAGTSVELGSVVTIADCEHFTAETCGGVTIQGRDLSPDLDPWEPSTVTVSQEEGSTLRFGGTTTANIGGGDLTLDGSDNTFLGAIDLKSAKTATVHSAGDVIFKNGNELAVDSLDVQLLGGGDGTLTLQDGTNSWTVSGADSGSITTGSIQNVVGEDPRFTFSGFTDL
uniref:two-partner secretion domain-containing protein n=1 Tax=Marinimicrobium locisalis TaxID=546022 RepID=UPI0032219BDB